MLKDNEIFCIKYKITDGFSVCKPPTNTDKYYITYFKITGNEVLLNKNINYIINNKFLNSPNVCINCGYDDQKNIISKTYYKIFIERKYPYFLFLVF